MCLYCLYVWVTCGASAPVYVCVVLGYCSPPVVEDTGPPGAPWETETSAEDLLNRDRDFLCMVDSLTADIYSDFHLKFFQVVFCKVVLPFVFMT